MKGERHFEQMVKALLHRIISIQINKNIIDQKNANKCLIDFTAVLLNFEYLTTVVLCTKQEEQPMMHLDACWSSDP